MRDGEQRARRAVAMLAHRGGDGSGVEVGQRFAFAHTRLSLVEAGPAGAQPMWNADGTLCLVFVGEIYNHDTLRRALVATGASFRGRSDTEVLLAGYERHGIGFLAELDGMFAIGLYDARDRSCLVARDRIGVKPLFYRWNGEELVFSVEPGPLNEPPYRSRMAGQGAVSSFLNYRFTLGKDTLWDGIQQMSPGNWIRVRNQVVTSGRWALPVQAKRNDGHRSGTDFKDAMHAVVGQYSRADVPVGLFLSGGLDSSLIAASLPAEARRRTEAFVARIDTPGYDETHYARLVARRLSLPLTEVVVGAGDQVGELDRLTRLKGFPLAIHNEVAVSMLSRAVRQRVKAVMSGEGADELAGGYARLSRIPFEAVKSGAAPDDHDAALALFNRRYGYFPLDAQLPLLRREHGEAARFALARDQALIAATWRDSADSSPFAALCATMTRLHLPVLLHMMDAMTMAENLELRVPFTSPRIVDLLLGLPDSEKLDWRFPGAAQLARHLAVHRYSERLDRTKVVFRRTFRRHLPWSVLHRRKQGFPVPWGAWMTGTLLPTITRLAQGHDSPLWDVFDRTCTAQWISAALTGSINDEEGKRLWMLIGLERWMRLN